MIIYKTTNLVNGKIYVGKNLRDINWYYGSGIHIVRAIKKYGKENFKKETSEVCSSIEELDDREKYWIKELDSMNPDIGYNLTEGGEGGSGFKHSEETKKLLSNLKKGKKFSEEARGNMRKANKGKWLGRKHTEESKEKIAIARRGKIPWNKGILLTEETKRKISQNCSGFLGKRHTKEYKIYMSNLKKGIKRSEETKRKISETKRREKIIYDFIN